uniref:Info solute carrier family 35 member F2, like n=1 Tax=Cyprinus carpio TaxID=7962 RepID=A0A8C1IWH7_CYPCA
MSSQRRHKMPQEQLDTRCYKIREGLHKWRDIFTWHLFETLLMGQGLSALISGTAVTSQYLASVFYLNTPMLQSFINYTLLGITYTVALIFRRGDGNILHILKTKWWKYLLLGLTDVEANYAVVKAYQYTTLTSIQLLDCFIIPVLMILSWFFLKTCYRIIHYVAVCICLAGVGADIIAGQDQGSCEKQPASPEHTYIIHILLKLYACGDKDEQCHSGQSFLTHWRPLQPVLWALFVPVHCE